LGLTKNGFLTNGIFTEEWEIMGAQRGSAGNAGKNQSRKRKDKDDTFRHGV
jgi:hypothetical protein